MTHATKYAILDTYLKAHVGQEVTASQMVLEARYPNSHHRKQTNLTTHQVGAWLRLQCRLGRVTVRRMMVQHPHWSGVEGSIRKRVQRSVYKVIQ